MQDTRPSKTSFGHSRDVNGLGTCRFHAFMSISTSFQFSMDLVSRSFAQHHLKVVHIIFLEKKPFQTFDGRIELGLKISLRMVYLDSGHNPPLGTDHVVRSVYSMCFSP